MVAMATTSTSLATFSFSSSYSSSSFSFFMCSIEKGTLLVRVASPFTVETLFISLRGKKRQCSFKEMLPD